VVPERRRVTAPAIGRLDAFGLARMIRRLEQRVRPEDLGGEPVAQLVRRWARLRAPEMDLAVRDHDPRWAEVFEAEQARLRAQLGDDAAAIHHIGSTAIPRLPGKNIIDIAVAGRALPPPARAIERLVALGYEPYGPSPIDPAFAWLWRIDGDGQGAVVVHVCAIDSPWLANLVNFRDYLRAFPDERHGYAERKRALASVPDQSWIEYSVAKRVLALRVTERANAWAASRGQPGA
jgi:GrpB-like predicted nucleotidyltransferase (UPF0157 family)